MEPRRTGRYRPSGYARVGANGYSQIDGSGPSKTNILAAFLALTVLAVIGLAIALGIVAGNAEHVPTETHDYVIVGAGSAGIVTGYLLEKDGHDVVVLEAGSDEDDNPEIVEAGNVFALEGCCRNRFFWIENGEKQGSFISDPSEHYSGGRVLGGSSTVNDQVYWRPKPSLLAQWGGYFTNSVYVTNFFKALETYSGPSQNPSARGSNGPFKITAEPLFPVAVKVIDAFVSVLDTHFGITLPIVDDWNTQDGPAISYQAQFWLDPQTATRQSTSRILLKQEGSNLDIRLNSTIDVVMFHDNTNKAIGVEYYQNGVFKRMRARKKVILAGGQRSFAVLERSGIGNPALLAEHNIPVRVANTEVGENAQNHLLTIVPGTANPDDQVGLAGNATVKRLAAFGHFPDPGLLTENTIEYTSIHPANGTILHFCILVKPESKGSAHIQSRDPFKPILPRSNYMSSQTDRDRAKFCIDAVKKTVDDLNAMDSNYTLSVDVVSDPEAYVLGNTVHIHHQAGTCGIGKVVDSNLHVIGTENLMVADVSVSPTMQRGHTYGSAVLIGGVAYTIITGNENISF